jgi:hypothetical protein
VSVRALVGPTNRTRPAAVEEIGGIVRLEWFLGGYNLADEEPTRTSNHDHTRSNFTGLVVARVNIPANEALQTPESMVYAPLSRWRLPERDGPAYCVGSNLRLTDPGLSIAKLSVPRAPPNVTRLHSRAVNAGGMQRRLHPAQRLRALVRR